jgi:hypothetical protein
MVREDPKNSSIDDYSTPLSTVTLLYPPVEKPFLAGALALPLANVPGSVKNNSWRKG